MGTVIKTQQTELYWASLAGVVNKAVSITGISGLSGAREAVDTSNLDTGVDRTYIAGSGSPGQVTVAFNVRRGELAHRALMNLRDSGDLVSWGVYSSEAATAPKAVAAQLQTASGRVSARFMGFVADVSVDMSGNSIWRGTIVIQRSGGVTWDLMTPDEEIAAMFANGEQGAWYDPSDWSTLFQDAAGTVPVTALEQPVGRMLDKSGRGNHASQATAGSRPVLSARQNLVGNSLLTGGGAVPTLWTQPIPGGSSAPVSSVISDGSGSLAYLQTAAAERPYLSSSITVLANTTYTFGVQVESVSAGQPANNFVLLNNVLAGAVATYPVCSANPSGGAAGVLTSGLLVVQLAVAAAGGAVNCRVGLGVGSAATGSVQFSRPRFENTSVLGRHQWTDSVGGYDAVGFPQYLRFDGVDDWLQTASIDMTSTGKMGLVTSVRKLSDAAVGVIVESSINANANSGSFYLIGPPSAAASSFTLQGRGSATSQSTRAGYAAPATAVLSGLIDLSASVLLRGDGAPGSAGPTAGGGSFGNYPLYLGRRAGASLPFGGNLYSLLLLGRLPTSAELAALETRAALRAGLTL